MSSHSRDKDGNLYANHRGLVKPNYQTRKLYDKSKNRGLWDFRGVDGEGGNVAEEGTLFGTRHQYLSLRCGPALLDTGQPLHWEQCFEFLTSQRGYRIDVAYFFDYDVTMMIRTFPAERAHRLLHRELRTNQHGKVLPLDIGDYQCEYLPHKEFKVRHKSQKDWTVISDVGQFFQSSFLKTLDRWDIGTPEEREMIRKGKMMRANFEESTDEIRAYNALECVLLEQLMTEFRGVCHDIGYVPKKWQGPGYLASAMLERHGIPKRAEIPILRNHHFADMAQAAYYGGRFETTACGPVNNKVWQYDINSAYPALLRMLPCLVHGSWNLVRTEPDKDTIYFAQVHFDHDAPKYLYNLPVRFKNGNIQFPKEGNGVYWSTELAAARRAGTHVAFQSGYAYKSNCNCRWFSFIDDYYKERLRYGKSNKGYALKLAGNSIYGKLAQSIGYAPFANPVWAGLITAGCRAQLIDAYSQAPDKCYMLATDGIFMGCELDLPVSKELGEWDLTEHPDGMFIVQPGVYFLNEDAKTRGVEHARIIDMRPQFEEQFRNFVESQGVNHTVSVKVQNFITAKQAIARNKWKIAGTWEHADREISFYWGTKRKPGIAFHRDGVLRTVPYDGGTDLFSVSYGKIIGGMRENIAAGGSRYGPVMDESERIAEQPDWVQPLLGE